MIVVVLSVVTMVEVSVAVVSLDVVRDPVVVVPVTLVVELFHEIDDESVEETVLLAGDVVVGPVSELQMVVEEPVEVEGPGLVSE